MFRKKKIEFLIEKEAHDFIDPPVKASKYIPEWLKILKNEYSLPNKEDKELTAKRCLPLIEACSEGYVWTTPCDIEFVVKEEEKGISSLTLVFPRGKNSYFCNSEASIIDGHGEEQVYLKEQKKEEIEKFHGKLTFRTIYKFNNLFVIKTPKGYSCRFKSLSNNFNLPFQFFEGVVETDHYYTSINFPFRYLGSGKPHRYMLKKGTPLVQIIPFKRDKWRSSVGELNVKQYRKQEYKIVTTFRNGYRNQVKENNGRT